MKYYCVFVFLILSVCAVLWSSDETSHPGTSPSPRHTTSPVLERQRNGISPRAFKKTFQGADDIFERDRKHICTFFNELGDLGHDSLILIGLSLVAYAIVMGVGLKRISQLGKADDPSEE